MSVLHIKFNEAPYKAISQTNILTSNGKGNWTPFYYDRENKIWYAAYSAALYADIDSNGDGALKCNQPLMGHIHSPLFPLKGDAIYPPFGPVESETALVILFGNDAFVSMKHRAMAFQISPVNDTVAKFDKPVSIEFYNFRVGSDIYRPRQPKRLEVTTFEYGPEWIFSAHEKGINAVVISANEQFQLMNFVLATSKSEILKVISGDQAMADPSLVSERESA